MMRLNNKGQSLVLFILVIPIMLGVMALVIDCGNVMIKKNEINNVIEMIIDYSFDVDNQSDIDTSDEDEGQEIDTSNDNMNDVADIKALLDYNLKGCHSEVSFDGSKMLIESDTYVEGIFTKVFGFKGFKIESAYTGYRDNSKIIKEKIK